MTPAAALEKLLTVSAEARKTAGLRLLRRSICDRVKHIDTHAGPGRLVVEVIISSASGAWLVNRSLSSRHESAEAFEWWFDANLYGPWFDLLDLDPEPTLAIFFKLLPHLNIDTEVLRTWAEKTSTARARQVARTLLLLQTKKDARPC